MIKKYVHSYSSKIELVYSTKSLSIKKVGSRKYTIKKRYDFYNH